MSPPTPGSPPSRSPSPSPSPSPSNVGRFPETHWSQIFRVGDPEDPQHRAHLDALLRRYWKPAYFYVRAVRHLSREDAEDLTQGFFAMVLTRVDFASLSPERGSFRGFVKTALRRFVLSHERKVSTQTERQHVPLFPFDEAEAARQDGEAITPEDAFDKAWAREVFATAMATLEAALRAEGKQMYVDVFRAYCVDGADDVSYESVAAAHGCKADDVRNYLRVVRQRGREIIKGALGDYVLPGEDLEAELRFVLDR